MLNVYNGADQTIVWIDDRVSGQTNPVRLSLIHIPSLKEYLITPLTSVVDLSGYYNGLYECNIIDNVTDLLITSFTLKMIDVSSLTLLENSYIPIVPKNEITLPVMPENLKETELGYIHNPKPSGIGIGTMIIEDTFIIG